MKVLLLNGSANKKGNTFTALTEIANRLEKNGVETEIMQLGNPLVTFIWECLSTPTASCNRAEEPPHARRAVRNGLDHGTPCEVLFPQ